MSQLNDRALFPASTAASYAVTVAKADGPSRTFLFKPGETIFVGSDPSCRLPLAGPGVASKHCLLQFSDDRVVVREWSSASGTFVDSILVEDEVAITGKATVTIADYSLRIAQGLPLPAAATGSSGKPSPALATRSPARREPVMAANFPELASGTPRAESRLPTGDEDLSSRLVAASPPEAVAPPPDHPDATADENFALWGMDDLRDSARFFDGDETASTRSLEQDTIELLKQEVALLQAELAERDACGHGLLPGERHHVAGGNDDAERTAVDERLAELLTELERNDQRVRALEELLLMADEARAAEQEERRQLETWIREIEDRVGQREQELRAEHDALRRRLRQAAEDRQRLEKRFEEAGREHGETPAQQLLVTLRQEYRTLQQQMAALEVESAQWKKSCSELEKQTDPGFLQRAVEAELRESRLALAQEQAHLSRLRVELTNKLRDLELEQSRTQRVSSADRKFQVFRETLKELHEKEHVEQSPVSLASRLANLWRKLDGPTDTD